MLRSRILAFSVVVAALVAATAVFAGPTSSQTIEVSATTITIGESIAISATECGGGLGGDYQVTYTVTDPDGTQQTFTTSQQATPPGTDIPAQTLTIEANQSSLEGQHTIAAVCEFIELGSSVLETYAPVTITILSPEPDTRFDIETPRFLDPDTDSESGDSGGAGGAGGAGTSGGAGGGAAIGFTG